MSKKLITIIGVYSVFIGVSVLIMWVMILSGDPVSEGRTEMGFHLLSEFLMAVLCILSGLFLLWRPWKWIKMNLVAHAMVIYSVLNAAGYYGERGEVAMMIMFVVLLVLSVCCIAILIRPFPGNSSHFMKSF